MKKINILTIIVWCMTLVASSCTDVLDQMPTTEDTSKDVYAEAANAEFNLQMQQNSD